MTEKRIDVVAAVIRRGGKVLLASRPEGKPPAGWEFPGGKLEPGESPEAALVRELFEELAVRPVPGELLGTACNGRIRLFFVAAELPDDQTPEPREGQRCFWVEMTPEPPEPLLPADRDFWRTLVSGTKNL